VGLNAVLIVLQMGEWADGFQERGWNPLWIYGSIGPLAALLAGFLAWLTFYPRWARRPEPLTLPSVPVIPPIHYRRIGVAVEFEGADDVVLNQAAGLAQAHGAELIPVHVVEGIGAALYGSEAADRESQIDRSRMAELIEHLKRKGLNAQGALGFGDPPEELVRIAQEQHFDLLVLGTHGHRFFADLALGQTVSPVLHRLAIPVLVVPTRAGTVSSE
jgi:manganese transport protein